ncbi:MAG: undecaprenyl-phosphate galactose phosphotransferase WbaP [Syntrophomonadaceae bacterium]|nr:undecaprenyl-phosphate galactose phosphotransferase WbaP [Syntrophomonadaceae bacterium]MDD4548897.1 undecaprenyl-phosphate galactose phosphotransferase WbaP [Syntrophomonadaceae bacterium]
MSKLICEAENGIVIEPPVEGLTAPMVSFRQSVLKVIAVTSLVLIDIAGLLAALALSYHFRIHILPGLFPAFPAAMPPELADKIYWVLGVNILCLAYAGLYTKRLPFWREIKRMLGAVSLAFILVLAAVSLAKLGGEVSRTVLVGAYIITLFILPLSRYLGKTILAKAGIWKESLIIMGTGKTGQIVAEALANDKYLGYTIAGFVSDDTQRKKRSLKLNGNKYPVLGRFTETPSILNTTGIRRVVVAAPELPGHELVALTNQLQPYTRSILVVPDLFGIPGISGEVDYFFDEQIIAFRTRNNLASRANIVTKRLFDLFIGFIMLIPAAPLMLILALIIKLDSPGPAVFSGNRIGKGAKQFKCYKFRTMYQENDKILEEYLEKNPKAREEWETYAKLREYDPRVTNSGKWMRKFSLDELPQLLNVMKGDMSLVGARPYLPREKEQMGVYADTILLGNPGITGLWQVSGRNEIDFDGRLRLEAWYVRNWSLWLDISLLFRTVGVVLGKKGAY